MSDKPLLVYAKEKIETAWNHAGTEMRYVKRVEG